MQLFLRSVSRALIALVTLCPFVLISSATAQVVPDDSLGTEFSSLTTDVNVKGAIADLIEGGAARGSNLFHSFSEFNVDEAQRVYFANPTGIESILSRVTGNNPSNIFGTLGVEGSADLFFLNPNGIVFGEKAALDVEGSFYGTTGSAIALGESLFSATNPGRSQLVSVRPSVFFENYLDKTSGRIVNRGAIAANQNLTLAAQQLDLQGQLSSGSNLTLLSTDSLKIRDTPNIPFIAAALGDLSVQGNEQVDLVAASHPDSGLYADGNLTLRSNNPIKGSTQYWSGGNFRVENLLKRAGNLVSPTNPVTVRTQGDVLIGEYEGASLHIIAGGSVAIDFVGVAASDSAESGNRFIKETVPLSNNTSVQIDSSVQPTLDVRAGVSSKGVGMLPPQAISGLEGFSNARVTQVPANADISINSVGVNAPEGLVLLTNQYKPSGAIAGNITIEKGTRNLGGIFNGLNTEGQGGNIILDARNNITVADSLIGSFSQNTSTGDIVLLAESDILFERPQGVFTGAVTSIFPNAEGKGGDIVIRAANLEVRQGATISSLLAGKGQSGDIDIAVSETVSLNGLSPVRGLPSTISNDINPDTTGRGGNLRISAANLEVLDGAFISASALGSGEAGNIVLNIEEKAHFDGAAQVDDGLLVSGVFSRVSLNTPGTGGNIELLANELEMTNGARISTSTFGTGNAGNVTINVTETARFNGADPIFGETGSGLGSSVSTGAQGNGGNVRLSATQLEIANNAEIDVSTFGKGDAGNVTLNIAETARLDNANVRSSVQTEGEGRGGNVELFANNLDVINGAQIGASTFGQGNAGNVRLNIAQTARFDGVSLLNGGQNPSGASSDIGPNAIGNGGNVELLATNLEITNGAQLSASVLGTGNAGNVNLNIAQTARIDGVNPLMPEFPSLVASGVEEEGEGRGGDVRISAQNLEVINGAGLGAGVSGKGDGGNIILDIDEMARFAGANPFLPNLVSGAFSSIDTDGVGQGGSIDITARDLEVVAGARLSAVNVGKGDAGRLSFNIAEQLALDSGTLATDTAEGAGGQINIQASSVIAQNNSDIQAFVSSGEGGGGNIVIAADATVSLDDSDILAFSLDGTGGNVDLSRTTFFGQRPNIALQNLSQEDLQALDGNAQVDINATGGIASGQISVNDASFIANNLSELGDDLVDSDALTATSCMARAKRSQGTFLITDDEGVSQRPDSDLSTYSTGRVQMVQSASATNRIQEPESLYRLADGRRVLSYDCQH